MIGGGQGGIALGARLRQLDVPTIVVDRHARPGDQWRSRYKSLCLHDPVWYDHLPYLPFPENWPVFAPKDKIGDWLEMYTKVMELNYWSSTTRGVGVAGTRPPGTGTSSVDRDGERAHPAPDRAGLRHRHVAARPDAAVPRDGPVPRRAAALLRPPRTRGLPGQEGRRRRVQQLRARHLRGAVGARRRRHDGAAQLDAHRHQPLADGHDWRACTPRAPRPPGSPRTRPT